MHPWGIGIFYGNISWELLIKYRAFIGRLVPAANVNHAVLKGRMLRPVPSHAGGQGFKSLHLHQYLDRITKGWQPVAVNLFLGGVVCQYCASDGYFVLLRPFFGRPGLAAISHRRGLMAHASVNGDQASCKLSNPRVIIIS